MRQGEELRSAAKEGCLADVQGLLNANADVNAADKVTVAPKLLQHMQGTACMSFEL